MKCQKFHMSTLSVVVHFNAIMTRLMAIARMKIHGTIFAVPKEMAAATGQPASMMGRSSPVSYTHLRAHEAEALGEKANDEIDSDESDTNGECSPDGLAELHPEEQAQ